MRGGGGKSRVNEPLKPNCFRVGNAHKVRYLGITYEGIIPSKGNAMRLTVLGVAVLAAASALGAGYITSVRLPDGTTKTFQDEGARQEIQGILSQKYLKPESVKAGDNVFVTTNAAGEVTISAVTGTESDFTTNNTVLVNTIETVAPAPVTSVNNKTGAVVLAASDIGALGNTGNQSLDGNLTFWGGNLAFVFEDAVLTPVIELWNGFQRLEFPMRSGTLALTSDIPSVAGLAPLASPAFTGTPTAPTPATGDNSTNIATTAFVQSALSSISVNPLAGNKYDFSTNADVYRAVKDIVEALGGSVTNFPAIP